MKRMLINATQEEELRMAMVDGQRLFDLNIEGPASERKKANIYKGKITRVEPSLEAAFVDYGAERHGFLPLKEISSEYFVKDVESGKPNIRDVLKEGQDIVVQIDKEERGNKGAALTTFVSLAGRFIVLKPNKAKSGGVSRRIVGSDRDEARQSLNDVDIPKDMSVILRTAGIDRSAEELTWDLETLMQVWQAILDHVLQKPAPFLLYRESNSVARALRDYLSSDVGEILIDDEATYKEAVEQVTNVMPHNLKKLKYYDDPVPLFTRFQIETQIESAFSHAVTLPSGGSIVIDHTEALVSIDINSARATKGSDIEATAYNTNLEAAEEIARQLRIRDLGGLIVIDFIDMGPQKNQREVENRLRDSVRQDRARVQIGKITRFGLLEMSRQRLRPSLGESAYQTCPRCSGIGTIRSVESLALAILRIIGEEARKERTAKVIAQLPVEVATYLLNEKRGWVQGLETSNDTQVVLVANSALETPHYDIRRVRDDQTEMPENSGVSYTLAEADAEPEAPTSMQERKAAEQAAIDVIKPATPAPTRKEKKESGGFWTWLTGLFSGDGEPKKKPQQSRSRRSSSSKDSRGRGSQPRGRGRTDQRQQASSKKRQRSRKKPAQKRQDGKPDGKPQAKSGQQTTERNKDKQATPQTPKKPDDTNTETKRPTRNRRSRGGRRRRRSAADRPAQEGTNEAQNENLTEAQLQQRDHEARIAAEKSPPKDKPAGNESSDAKPVADKPPAEKPRRARRPKPDAAATKTDSASEGAAPRARTDAERVVDSAPAKADARPQAEAQPQKTNIAPQVEAVPKAEAKTESKPAAEPKAESKAEAKPKAESKPAAEPNAEPKADAKPKAARKPRAAKPKEERKSNGAPDKTEPKAADKPAAKPVEAKPEAPVPKPAAKTEGRLLPWDPSGD